MQSLQFLIPEIISVRLLKSRAVSHRLLSEAFKRYQELNYIENCPERRKNRQIITQFNEKISPRDRCKKLKDNPALKPYNSRKYKACLAGAVASIS